MQEVQPLIYSTTFQCQNQHPASLLCSNEGCFDPALICNDKSCDCYTVRHQKCKQKDKLHLKSFIQQHINDKRQKLTQSSEEFYQKLIGVCDDLIERLSQDKLALIQAMQMPGIGYYGRQFINFMNDNRFQMIQGDLINDISQEVSPKLYILTYKADFQKKWTEKNSQFEQLRQLLRMNEKIKFKPKLSSVIIDIVGQSKIRQFLQRKVKDFQLLYRYVQKFGKKDFHNCCDDVSDTLVIVKTKFGKIIGGYTPIPWKSPVTRKYISDPSRKTFLFSLSLNQKYPLVQPQGYAVIHDSGVGPIFGGKNVVDLMIKDSNMVGSFSNFPGSFNDEKKLKTKEDFIGFNARGPIGNNTFDFVEYEVFKVKWK